MLFFNFLVGFVLALAALVNAVPISEDGLQAFNITVPGLNASRKLSNFTAGDGVDTFSITNYFNSQRYGEHSRL
jgi:hypothetical protein